MSSKVRKGVVIAALFVGCATLTNADEGTAVPNGIKFTGGTPAGGGAKGEIATTVAWEGLQLGIAKVEITLYETVAGKEKTLDSKTKAATTSPGTWAHQFTGLTSGKVVTRGYARTMDNTMMAPTITDTGTGAISVTVP